MGMGGGGGRRSGPGAGMGQGFGGGWNFSSNVDPEELFRKIFGEAGFKTGFGDYEDFAESHFGYGAAQEVLIFGTLSARFFEKMCYFYMQNQ